MDIDEDGVTDPTAEFGDLFEGQTVAFENELVGHDADDVLGAISHDLGITSGTHHRPGNHPSDHDILAANLSFVPDDYLHGQQIVMDHENSSEYMALQGVTVDAPQNLNNQQPDDSNSTNNDANQQLYMQPEQEVVDQPTNVEEVTNNTQLTYEYNYNQVQQEPEVTETEPTSKEVPTPPEPVPEVPKVKRKIKIVKDVEYFTNENMQRYMKRRGFKSKRGEVNRTKSISKTVFALSADTQISSENFRLVSFGSRYDSEYVVQEMERFWKFYLSTKNIDIALSTEFLPMLIPMLLHFYFEMMLAHVFPIARRICIEFSKKFFQEHKSQYDVLVAVMKVNSLETLKTDSILSPLLHRKFDFTLSELALCHLRHFLSKSTQPILIQLFTKRFRITTRESKEVIESYDWDNLNSESSGSSEEEDEVYKCKRHVKRVIERLRRSSTANLPSISVYTTADDPVCGNISNKGTLVAYGLAEAGIRICPVENARDVTDAEVWDSRPSDPESFYGIKSIGGHDGTVYGVHFHPRTKLLFSVGQDSFMRAWDLNAENPRCRVVYRGHSGPIWRLDIPQSGSLIATAGLDTTARIFVPERTEFVRVMAGHYCSVNAVKFHPNEAYIATGSADKSARLWSINDGNVVRMFTGSAGSVNCVAFHESGKYLVGAGEDAKIIIWDLAQGEVLAKLDSLPNCRDLEFNGHMLSACYRNGILQVFNLRSILGGNLFSHNRRRNYLTSISTPFTTQCFAKTLFKVHFTDPGRLLCLGSDMSMDVDDINELEIVKARFEAEMAKRNANEETPISDAQETILQQVLQTNIPPVASTSTSDKPSKKKGGGVVTVMGSNGSSRILAARLSQPVPSISSCSSIEAIESVENDSKVAIQDSPPPVSSGGLTPGNVPSVTPAPTSTPQMITSAELDAAIASVIDQSGCDNAEGGGGTITMYASS